MFLPRCFCLAHLCANSGSTLFLSDQEHIRHMQLNNSGSEGWERKSSPWTLGVLAEDSWGKGKVRWALTQHSPSRARSSLGVAHLLPFHTHAQKSLVVSPSSRQDWRSQEGSTWLLVCRAHMIIFSPHPLPLSSQNFFTVDFDGDPTEVRNLNSLF